VLFRSVYFQIERSASEILLSQALSKANSFSLAARAAEMDDGVLDRMAKEMRDETVAFAYIYTPTGESIGEAPKMEAGELEQHRKVHENKSFSFASGEDGEGRSIFELWYAIRPGGPQRGQLPETSFTVGPRLHRLRILHLGLHTHAADRLIMQARLHAGLITLLIVLFLILTMRQLRQMAREEEFRKKISEQERFAELGRLSAVLAHEIRNPLGAIKGFAQYAAEGVPDGDPRHEDMQTVIKETSRLERLVQSLLHYAKPQQPAFAAVDLNQFIARTLKLIERDAFERKTAIKVDLPPQPLIIDGDEELLTQALLNVFINGLEAMAETGGRLTVSLSEKGSSCIISVADQGEGLSPEILEKLFEPYVTKKTRGTGLGLAVAKRIVTVHGGEIFAENLPEGGALFTIELPARLGASK
jgi:signal transduction histidine kinase